MASYIDVSLMLSEFLLDGNQIERANIYIDKASALSNEFNFKLQSCKAALLESRLLASYRKWNEAEELGLGAHACATDRMDIMQQLATAKNLLNISLNTNNSEQAKNFLKEYESLLETQFDVEQQKASARLEVEYQNQQQEAENAFLKSQKEKNEKTIRRQRLLALLILLLGIFATGASLYAYRIKTNQRNVLEEKVNERTKELNDTNSELELSNKELERSNEELERFAYIASHDLKQPLNTIISFSGLLNRKLKGKIDASTYGHLQLILNGGQQMKKLIEDLLEYSKTGHEKMAPEWIDLNILVEDVKASITDYIGQSNAEIIIAKTLPSIFAEKTKMFLVFKNLIENGIKFNLSEKPLVELGYDREGDTSVLTFKDNGIGISEDYHKIVFKMFTRLHAKNEYDGTGLGLSLCKRIVLNMESNIFLEKSGEEGSVFSIELPSVLFKELSYAD